MPTLHNKGIITKDICEAQIKPVHNTGLALIGIALVLFGVINISSNLIAALLSVAAGAIMIVIGIKQSKDLKTKIDRRRYYLTIDTVAAARERKGSTGGTLRSVFYTFAFRENGSYTVSKPSNYNIVIEFGNDEITDYDDEALKCFYEGEKFYVLVLEDEKSRRIERIFNVCYFDIDMNDFTESNGKYYPKLS